ncbi:MAG: ubiquinone biosynthesis accessory factor UbiJ [Pseudomonadota bacterium]
MHELIQMVAAGLERAANAALALDPEAARRLAPLEGRTMAVVVRGTGVTVAITPSEGGLLLGLEADPADADAVVTGAPLSLLRLVAGEGNGPVHEGAVTITGDTGFAQSLNAALAALDIDWEEHAARLVGDATAYSAGRAVRSGLDWLRGLAATAEANAAEYAREEADILPSAGRYRAWSADVARLRDDVARLEARLRLLEEKRGGGQ